ncbi:MAG: cyclic nucleotide-binding domain-containing protein [Bacteriovoracaceae bacterium]|nr:cyclic nucleotide-binding domain-containing protein [Bacteriovoracaceae bacterium]
MSEKTSDKNYDQILNNAKELKKIKSGLPIFKEGDVGRTIYILQTGQVRLFKTKGKGFFELGVIRPGEIFGELSLWDDGHHHAMSAEALGDIEYLELESETIKQYIHSGPHFLRALYLGMSQGLKRSYLKLKEFESASLSYGDEEYVFIKDNEVAKLLATYYLIGHTFGSDDGQKMSFKFNKKLLKIYGTDIYGINESKIESLFPVLKNFQLLTTENSPDGQIFCQISNLEFFRTLISFYQTERFMPDEKKLKIPQKTFIFLEDILSKVQGLAKDEMKATKDGQFHLLDVSGLLENYSFRNMGITTDDLMEAKKHGLVRDALVGQGKEHFIELQKEKLFKYVPIIKFQFGVKKLNDSKNKT